MKHFPLVFLHVPKTAGTTVRAIIERQYPPEALYTIYEGAPMHHQMADFKQLPEDQKKKVRVFAGHLSYGLHRSIPGKVKYFAMLREPVARVVSYYHHVMNHNVNFKTNRVSLLKFFQRQDRQLDNHQTRILSGIHAPFGKCNHEMLWTAIENIEQNFCLVGLTEMFDESLVLLGREMNWKSFGYVRENISVNKPNAEYFSKTEISAIENRNRLDLVLYSYARRRLEQQIESLGKEFQDALNRLQEEKAACEKMLKPKAVWKTKN